MYFDIKIKKIRSVVVVADSILKNKKIGRRMSLKVCIELVYFSFCLASWFTLCNDDAFPHPPRFVL